MKITLEFDSSRWLLRVRATGLFDTDVYRKTLAQVTSEKQYSAATPAIWDLRAFDFTDFDTQLAYNVKNVFSLFKSRGSATFAFVVSTELGYGMMRMLQVLLHIEENSLVCYDYDEADEWIRQRIPARPPHPREST